MDSVCGLYPFRDFPRISLVHCFVSIPYFCGLATQEFQVPLLLFPHKIKKKYQERKETNQNEQTRDYHKCEMGFQEKLYLFNLQPSRALIIPSFSTALHHNPDFFISSQKEVIFNDTKGLILNPTKLFNKFYVRHCQKKNFLLFQTTAAWDPIKLSRAGP